MPRAPSMIPKRRRKGSVAMEEVTLGRTYVAMCCLSFAVAGVVFNVLCLCLSVRTCALWAQVVAHTSRDT